MLLAGDVGATKVDIGIFHLTEGIPELATRQRLSSAEFPGLTEVIGEFLGDTEPQTVAAACFGVAGPILGSGIVTTTNLPWQIDGAAVARATGLPKLRLINDLVATAEGLDSLAEIDFANLQSGVGNPQGHRALLAAGTGLGMAMLARDGNRQLVLASEGGHADFAPRNDVEIGLLRFLSERFEGHVSTERVVSGTGLRNIYDYFVVCRPEVENPDIRRRLSAVDAAPVIVEAALSGECRLCAEALDLFVDAYGAAAGNLALLSMATGGIYIAGGIAAKIFPRLPNDTLARFARAFLGKGRFRPFLEKIPVRLVLRPETALLGAARLAARCHFTAVASDL